MHIKINNKLIGNVEDLDIVMLMYNLLEYSCNYSMTWGSLWKYYRDEINDDGSRNNSNCRINNDKTTNKSFEYKTKMIGKTLTDNNTYTEVVA